MQLPDKKYSVIYADPPWTYAVWSKKGEGRTASAHYNVMSKNEICALPIADLAAPDCTLLMWATWPNLIEAVEVIKAWGFTYKTCAFLWVKQNRKAPPMFADQRDFFMGLGHWTRANSEFCLLATRGKPKRIAKSIRQVICSPIREHSRKPDEAYQRIEALLPAPYIELFARNTRENWDSWGNQTTQFNQEKEI